MQKALLLLLGCAVQCENKELYIDKIKNLDLNIQHDIVEHIKQVIFNFHDITFIQFT